MIENSADNRPAGSGAEKEALRDWVAGMLMDLCRVDTTPRQDVASLGADEERVFTLIESSLQAAAIPGLRLERRPIDPRIATHPLYSNPMYAAANGTPPPAADVYRDRSNLLATVDGAQRPGGGLALNVHVDVVCPYIPPRLSGGTLFGRGACDDKGPLVSLLGAIRLLGQYMQQHDRTPEHDLTLMFVIDEESGGNGSLSAAVDRKLKQRYDALMVLECCSSRIHPGNRGAVWYQVNAQVPNCNLFEASAFIIEEMENEGRALKAESRHDLFPHRPVQTCHGIMGGFGEHPSRICGRIEFLISPEGGKIGRDARVLIDDLLEWGLAEYVGLYGDKTQVMDPATGRPKVETHYEVAEESDGLRVRVFGATGHMGSILQNDGAITKAAAMVRSLVRSREAMERMTGGKISLRLADWPESSKLAMEGGQGFLPTHSMDEVQQRLREAVWRGAAGYLHRVDRESEAESVSDHFRVTYDKLHNAAFTGDPDSSPMRDAIAAARTAGIWPDDEPVRGWDVSCDSRIFATEYPEDLVVLTGGPGHLRHAHADNEQVELEEVVDFAIFLYNFILRRCLPDSANV